MPPTDPIRTWHARRVLALLALRCLFAVPASAQSTPEARVVEAVCNKQIVVLGELPSHGEARGFQAKARIAQRLIERCGFDAVLFEAPIYDFIGFQQAAAQRQATPLQLDRGIGRFWWTRELAEWRGWLYRRAASGTLVLGGLDDQVSATSEYARATLPGLVGASSGAECEQAVARNLNWRYDEAHAFDEPERVRLHRCARAAADALASRGSGTPEQVMAENLAGYFHRQLAPTEARTRDEAMYRNFVWQSGRMPRGSKWIIWTATVHAARRQGTLTEKPLGARLAERWGDRVGVIGFSALAGRSSRAGRPSEALSEAPPGSLEAQALGTRAASAYLDRRALRRIGSAPSRLFGRYTSADWSTHFDGVVVFREEVAPVFEPLP
ncbi:MAG TPA: erythromycin esterase family protein [Longimicrobium sp.]|jgi:erythromycin esterase-like protein